MGKIDYQKYINALRKCAQEHENDRTSTGHVVVSDLCRDTANLLEELEQESIPNKIFSIVFPLSFISTPELEHKAIMQIAEMLEPLCLPESEDKE